MKTITPAILKQLRLPKPNSRKRDNGRLLIIAGNEKYFGALVYAIKAASRIVDLVYVLTTPENQKMIEKMKLKTAEFMPTPSLPSPQGRGKEKNDIDAILIGPGMGISARTENLVRHILKSDLKTVLDADALNVLNNNLKKKLSQNHILTPHHREFRRLFQLPASAENVEKMMKKYNCTIVLKGPVDYIANPNKGLWQNKTGNAGMTKGGTGDVLAGLIAAFYCTNDAFTSAAAGAYLNGKAGDDLHKKVGTFYNAEDLAEQLPLTLKRLVKSH
ncbi:MAG: NAD(P)H-hydrate dehydratase [bacterium]|nr:NAD(P)H-hydrate dehydratase [bacterium]